MKKFNHANIGLFALFTALLCLSSCNSDDDNYPKEYVGFEHSTLIYFGTANHLLQASSRFLKLCIYCVGADA